MGDPRGSQPTSADLVVNLSVARGGEGEREVAVLVDGIAADGVGQQAHREAVLLQLVGDGIRCGGGRGERQKGEQNWEELHGGGGPSEGEGRGEMARWRWPWRWRGRG